MNVREMNQPTCRMIGKAVLKALVDVEKKFNIKFSQGNGRYSTTSYTMKIEASVIQNGAVITKEATAFKQYAEMYGLKATDLGKTFVNHGKYFEITGLNTRARKYKINAKIVGTESSYKFEAPTVARLLKG